MVNSRNLLAKFFFKNPEKVTEKKNPVYGKSSSRLSKSSSAFEGTKQKPHKSRSESDVTKPPHNMFKKAPLVTPEECKEYLKTLEFNSETQTFGFCSPNIFNKKEWLAIKVFAEEQKADENTLFIEAVANYFNSKDTAQDQCADDLYKTYVKPDAEHWLNISAENDFDMDQLKKIHSKFNASLQNKENIENIGNSKELSKNNIENKEDNRKLTNDNETREFFKALAISVMRSIHLSLQPVVHVRSFTCA